MPRRKLYSKVLRVMIDEDTYQRLKKISEALRSPMADIVRIAVRSHLKRLEEELGYVSNPRAEG